MGLLDDAIREHLDLKRRRGADPSEIAREESEALGPVRRAAPEEEPGGSYADYEPAALDAPGAVYDDEPAPVFDDERPEPAEPPRTHDAPYLEPEDQSATPPHGDPLAHEQTREFSATELGEALGHDGAPPAPSRPSSDVVPGDDEGEDAAAADAEDELEETPDFLQETPEHDRLWFEQKPPKDFDF
jgi:hypothetical protein